jgi:uncharacterized membrane protein
MQLKKEEDTNINMKLKNLNPILIVIILITLFVFIISFTAFYTKENFSSMCGCKLPIWVIIISISSFGMFTGSLIYYFLSFNIIKEKQNAKISINKILNFLEENEKEILKLIIKNKGKITQSSITKELKLDKVKVSRIINTLEKKEIIKREKQGMTNLVKLNEQLKEIFE